MGERRGGNIFGHNGLDERGGRRVMHADFFTRGGVVGPAIFTPLRSPVIYSNKYAHVAVT